MTTQLDSLRSMTVVVADTGDIDAIKKYQPQDATTNPSLILSASALPQYAPLIDEAITYAKAQSADKAQQLIDAEDKLAVNIGLEILKLSQDVFQLKWMHVFLTILKQPLKKHVNLSHFIMRQVFQMIVF